MINLRKYMKEREKPEKEEEPSLHKKLWSHRSKKLVIVIGALLLAVILAGAYQYYRTNLIYTEYDVLSVSELTEITNGEYKAYGDYILRYSMDGISCMDKNGGLVWGQAYEIKNPIVDVCGDYAAVAAQNGNEIYIFNKSGYQGEVKTQYLISRICVAGQGVVAAILEDSGNNYIKLYDKAGNELVKVKTALEGEGYPFAVALSEDGRKMVVSYLNVDGNTLKNTVEFYNFSDVGQNYVQQMVGVFKEEFENSLVPQVEFINNDTACAFADNQAVLFQMKEIPEIIKTIPIEERIQSVFYSEGYIGLIVESEQEGAVCQLRVYTADGAEVSGISGRELAEEYTAAAFAGEAVMLYNEYSCELINMKGVEKFSYSFDKKIVLLKNITESRYTLITPSSISEIRLK